VIIYHYTFVYYKDADTNNIFIQNFRSFTDYLNLGAFGVSLFFLISGFVIPMSLKGNDRKLAVKNFAIRRFFRLYPTYWVAIILISTIILFFKDSNAYSMKQILTNFTMLQDIFKVNSIDGVFWTLMVELKFYILTAILFYFSLLKKIRLIIGFFLILSIVTLFNWDGTFNPIINAILHRNNLWSYLMLMYLGTGFYFYHIGEISKNNLIFLISIVSIYFFISHYFKADTEFGSRLGYSIATLSAILSFIVFSQNKQTISRITTFFGNISYPLYLLHQVLGYFIITVLLNSSIYLPFAQIITILIITLVTVLVNKYIEIPTNKLGYRYVKQNK